VTIHYCFHPLRGQSLPVIRKYDFLDEVHYIVRRADGRPLAVAAWMTQRESAGTRIVSAGRLPIRTMLEMLCVVEASSSRRSRPPLPPLVCRRMSRSGYARLWCIASRRLPSSSARRGGRAMSENHRLEGGGSGNGL